MAIQSFNSPPEDDLAADLAAVRAQAPAVDDLEADLAAVRSRPSAPVSVSGVSLGSDRASVQARAREFQDALKRNAAPVPVGPQRPAPVHATGFTDPNSVRVTEPALRPSRTGEGPMEPRYVAADPAIAEATGVPSIVRGTRGTATGIARAPAPTLRPTRTGEGPIEMAAPPPLTPEIERGLNELTDGFLAASAPLVGYGLIRQPLITAAGVLKAVLAQKVGEKAAEEIGASPEGQHLVGNIAALLSGSLTVNDARAKINAAARPLVLAGRLSGYGVGDVPAYRAPGFGELGVPDNPAYAEQVGRTAPRPPEPTAPPSQVPPAPVSPGPGESPAAPTGTSFAEDLARIRQDTVAARDEVFEPPDRRASNAGPPAGRPERRGTYERVVEKYANGELQPSADAEAAFKEKQRVEAVRAAAGTSLEQDLAQVREENDATRQPGAARVDVGQPPANGAPVGSRNAEGQETAGTGASETSGAGAGRPAPETVGQSDTTHEFASTQINLPPQLARELLALGKQIPAADLADDGKEAEPHVTVKFGLHENDPEAVRQVLAGEPPITLRFGKTSFFPNGESGAGDVVKVDIDSPDLHRLNQKIADALPHTDTHPTYVPHATVAYVKPGKGETYAGNAALEGRTVTVDRVVFSGKNDERIEIPLTGTSTEVGHAPLTETAPAAAGNTQAAGAPSTKAPVPVASKAEQPYAPVIRAWSNIERPPTLDVALTSALPEGKSPVFYAALKQHYENQRTAAEGNSQKAKSKNDRARWKRIAADWGRVAERAKLHQASAGSAPVAPKGEANPASRYAGDNLDALVPQVEKEQRGRRIMLQHIDDRLERTKIASRRKALEESRRELLDEYEGTYSELADAGGQQLADELRARVEGTAAPERGKKARMPVAAKGARLEEPTHEAARTQAGNEPQDHARERAGADERGTQPTGGAAPRAEARGRDEDITADPPRTDADVVDGLIHTAQAGGFTGDVDTLRTELAGRLQLVHDLDEELAASGRNPIVLLKEQEKPTPEFEAPFSLTGEVDTTVREREGDLFGRRDDEEPQFARKRPPIDRIRREALAEQRELQRAYDTMPLRRIGDDQVAAIYDTGRRLTPEELSNIVGDADVQRVIRTIVDVSDEVLTTLLGDARPGVERIGVIFDDRVFGIFFPRPGGPGPTDRRRAMILINPFEAIQQGASPPVITGIHVLETIVHEAVHWQVGGHGTDFKTAYDEAIRRLGLDYQLAAQDRLTEAYADPDRPQALRPALTRALSVYAASRRRRATTDDPVSRAEGYESRPTDDSDRSRGDDRDVRRDRSRAPRLEVTRRELAQLAKEQGTPVDVQQRRAEAAGYTVVDEARGVELQATVIPGAKEFLAEDVVPALGEAAARVGQARNELRAIFAPDTLSAGGTTFAGIMRAHLAAHTQRVQRAQKQLRSLEKAFDKRSNEDNLSFIDAIETGHIADLSAGLRGAAEALREILDAKRKQVQQRGKLQAYIEHYFPHEWAKPSQIRQVLARLMGRKPLQGSKAFLKQRSIPTVKEGVAAGLTPSSYNPVTLVLHKLVEMDKFLLGHDVLAEAKALAVAKFIRIGKKPPADWIRYHESFGTVYAPPTIDVAEAYDERLMKALNEFATTLGVTHTRAMNIGGKRWGYAQPPDTVVSKAAGPEGVIMHEIGHILDERYGLRHRWVKDKQYRKELRALADLRYEGHDKLNVPQSFRTYVRKGEEKIANLVHAFIWAPDKAKQVAPGAYWALWNLSKEHAELAPLRDLQKMRSMVLGTQTHQINTGTLNIMGYYYGPADAVRILNHYLSPGLRGNALFNGYRTLGNVLNQTQLGLSAFHLMMVSLESVISRHSVALQQLSRGDVIAAAKKLPGIPLAPILHLVEGHRFLKHYYDTDVNARTFDTATGLVIQGGGGIGWDKFWHGGAPERFMRTLRQAQGAAERGNYPGAAARVALAGVQLLPAAIELQAKPIMEWFVPRLKIGAYLEMARMELETLGPTPQLTEVRRVLGEVWDSVDNRFGELRYDNLFWHNALKDLGLASVRALGWNVGTVREVFGAPGAQLKNLGLAPAGGGRGGGFGKRPTRLVNVGADKDGNLIYEDVPEPLLHRKMAYLLSLLWIAGLTGAIYQYAHTGERPQELRDYYFPRTGRKKPDGTEERVSLPSYFKDLYAVLRDFPSSAIDTVSHKVHPAITMLTDILQNEDFFGVEIRNPDDPLLTQVGQAFEHVLEESEPFQFRNAAREADTFGASTRGRAVENFFGITPAPATVSRSAAETVLHRQHEREGHTTVTRDQATRRDTRREIRRDLRSGDVAGAGAAAAGGTLTPRQLQQTARESGLSALQLGFRDASLENALAIYEAATPQERRGLSGFLGVKIQNAAEHQTIPPAQFAMLRARIQKALALPIARAPVPVAAR